MKVSCLNNKIVLTRSEHKCHTCKKAIKVGSKAIFSSAKVDDIWDSLYICEPCTEVKK